MTVYKNITGSPKNPFSLELTKAYPSLLWLQKHTTFSCDLVLGAPNAPVTLYAHYALSQGDGHHWVEMGASLKEALAKMEREITYRLPRIKKQLGGAS